MERWQILSTVSELWIGRCFVSVQVDETLRVHVFGTHVLVARPFEPRVVVHSSPHE